MSTETSLTILVVILSITLILFLALAVALVIKLLQIASVIKRITLKAEDIADKAEAVTDFFEKSTTTVAVGKLLSNIFEVVNRKKK